MPRVIAVANPAGRSGKTTTAVGLASMLADLGQMVLAVDLDAQGDLTRALDADPEALPASLFDVLVRGLPVLEVMTDSEAGVDLVPATLELSSVEGQLVTRAGREMLLRGALAPVADDYDWIVLDCPSSMGLLTINALAMADLLLVPVREPSARAMGQLAAAADEIRSFVNRSLSSPLVVGMGAAIAAPGYEQFAVIPAAPLALNAYRELAKRLIAS